MTLSKSPVLTSGRRGPRRAVPRLLAVLGAIGVGLFVVWVLTMLSLWIYAWARLGGIDLRALDEDVERFGVEGAIAPVDATTVMIVLTEPKDATRLDHPALAAPVALLQVGGPRDDAAVVLLPTELVAFVDGQGSRDLTSIQREGGIETLATAIIDYTQVRVDHVVSFSVDALPRLVEIVEDVEVCLADGCRLLTADDVRRDQDNADHEFRTRLLAATVRALATELSARSVATSPLAAKRAVDVVAEEIDTDVSLRGRELLRMVRTLAAPVTLSIDVIPMLHHPVTGELVPLDEPALVRFQHLQRGTPLQPKDHTAEIAELVLRDLRIAVLNGAGIAGLAANLEAELRAEGFHVVGTGNAAMFDHATTTVSYAAGDGRIAAAAAILAEQLGGVRAEEADGALRFEGQDVDVVITAGADRRPAP